ncbi:zinc finger protein, putative [Plasmodium berghei ANKA]|uniref:Zinc finger protein, putative n=1 Tax=Plasmodium berghei (strain Anka) TaxID=5823 RepID=A0A509AN67_PLABA|nr:zinc finger protein, putative [Plasmodium berghei ANKA]VUC57522.1 zinc finger protein, putative [Plasmodium berghei ANKA]|eukprot:XP_034423293.1 zinc finger protein, putative [Plasmodium berghei ANKA]
MYINRNPNINNNKRYDALKYEDEKETFVDKPKYINVSYHIRKLFSYCDADILRIENNLIIYNSIIDNIKKNGNRLIKKEIEKIIREKEENKNYCLKDEMKEEYKINNFDLKKVELDFKFIECSLCFELIKIICIQECNHTYCFLCFYRLLYMQIKENNYENNDSSNNNNNNNNVTGQNALNNVRNNNHINSRSYSYRDRGGNLNYDESYHQNSRTNDTRKNIKNDKFNYAFDKEKMKCPFCKERNEYIFFCLNNFYTYFTYNNLLQTLLEHDEVDMLGGYDEDNNMNESEIMVKQLKFSGSFENDRIYDKRESINNINIEMDEQNTINKYSVDICKEIEDVEEIEKLTSKNYNDMQKEQANLLEKNKLKKIFSSDYDDIIILRNILKKYPNSNEDTIKNTKKGENMYLFNYYEKYIKRKKYKTKYILNGCANSLKRYAFFSKIFVDTEKKIFYEYYYIYSLSTLLTSYVCLLTPCIDYWVKVQNKKVEKFKLNNNNKINKYFEYIYIHNKQNLLRKKNDSIYDKYHQYTRNDHHISELESESTDHYFNVIDIFYKTCFTNLDNITNLKHLNKYCYNRLSDLCKHLSEHKKTYCDICVGNNDNNFLFEYNIFLKKHVKAHIEYGEQISENKYKIRHIYCHICSYYLYDFDTYMSHINKYHFFCKFCFNKKNPEIKGLEKNDIDDIVYYDQLHLHVYKDYDNIFAHYKKKHHPCLYEQCIFVVFDNKMDLCLHLAEKHEERGSSKRNKIAFSIGGASYNEIRNNANNNRNNTYSYRNDYGNNINAIQVNNEKTNSNICENEEDKNREKIDINNYKCIYDFKNFSDSWYFEYFIEIKMINFVEYFKNKKTIFLHIIKKDLEFIENILGILTKKNADFYISNEEIINITKSVIDTDFGIEQKKNNFFIFKIFFDGIIEKIDYLLYNKEDLEKHYLNLFFNIIIYRSFILYYSFFFMHLSEKKTTLGKINNNTNSSKTKKNVNNSNEKREKNDSIYNYNNNKSMANLRHKFEDATKSNINELSKYGFLYLTFLFFKIENNVLENIHSNIKGIYTLCNNTWKDIEAVNKRITLACENDTNAIDGKSKNNDNPLIISGNKKSNNITSIKFNNEKNNTNVKGKEIVSSLFDVINSKNNLMELENIYNLIKKCFKNKNPNNNIINHIYDQKWDICKKVSFDMLYCIEPHLNLVSFFYLFISNYLSAYQKDSCVNKFVNISNENKKNILKKIALDVDLASLTTISKDLSNFVNARALEECLSTGPEYYRIRKDIEFILRNRNTNNIVNNGSNHNRFSNTYRGSEKYKNIEDQKVNSNLYDISLSLRNRFLNIIKSSKINELYYIYFYVSSIINTTNTNKNNDVNKNEDFPSLASNNINDRTSNIATISRFSVINSNNTNLRANHTRNNNNSNLSNEDININSYKYKVENNKNKSLSSKGDALNAEYPPLPKQKTDEDNFSFLISKNNKTKPKDSKSELSNKDISLNWKKNGSNTSKYKEKEEEKKKQKNNKKTNNTTADHTNTNLLSLIPNKIEKSNKNEKNKAEKNATSNYYKSFNIDEFPAPADVVDQKKLLEQKQNSQKKKKNYENNSDSKHFYSSDDNTLSNSKSSPKKKKKNVIVPEGNITYTIKKNNKVKCCSMCTYENPYERKICELCENPL